MYNTILRKLSGKRLFLLINLLLFFYFTSLSQTKDGARSPFSMDIYAGLALPIGGLKNYATNGFQTGLLINKALHKNLALGLNTNFKQLGITDKYHSPEKYWNAISFGVGPQYTVLFKQFFIQFNAHLGAIFIKTPSLNQQQVGKPDYFKEDMTVLQLDKGQHTGFYSSAGMKAGINLSEKINLFISSTYNADLNKATSYQHRNLSTALHESGEVHVDVINSTPFEEKKLSFSNLGINLGFTINLGKTTAIAPAQDYNSSRSNKPRPIAADVNHGKDTVTRPAQDYNSSRSNKPRPIAADVNHGKDTVTRPAQDYNSSRSNKPRPKSSEVKESEEAVNKSTKKNKKKN